MTETAMQDLTEAPAENLIDLTELSQSLTGFDQIAIRQFFHERFDTLMEDPILFMRAMYFVHLTREAGAKASDAYRAAMNLPLGEVSKLFETTIDEDEEFGEPSAVEERDRQFAEFVIGTGLSYTLDQFMSLTIQQRAELITAANKR